MLDMKKLLLLLIIFVGFFSQREVFAQDFSGNLCPPEQQLTQNLKRGARDGRYYWYTKGIVREAHLLQEHLNRLGFASGKVDGILGPVSDGAIKRMQIFLGVKPDGYVGPRTRYALNHSCESDLVVSQNNEIDFKNPVCVYNHAYQENYQNDSITNILKNARGCYVLIDPLEDNAVQYINQIKAKGNQVGCYMSVGTGEDWRSDFDALKPYLAKEAWGDWEGEYFVSRITPTLSSIMKKRIKQFADFGCDWIEFDNMDWGGDDEYREEYNLKITQDESENYVRELCTYAKSLGMKCMAKSTTYGDSRFDGLTLESYVDEKDWWEKGELKNILRNDKLGIIVHYDEKRCNEVYEDYQEKYGTKLSFICEDRNLRKYRHYNQK